MYYNPPHEVRDVDRLEAMIASLLGGKCLPPIVVIGDSALTGSHRIEAWSQCDMEPDAVEVSDADYIQAMESIGLDAEYDTIGDYNEICAALYRVTDDGDIKAALADQR